jgi:glycerol-3-phosphate acyltransferase PlsY
MLTKLAFIAWREAPGILAVLGYFIVMPPLMAMTVFRKFFVKMGFLRYMIMANLLLVMAMLPIKMMLRWTINLKYIISIPEYFLNL